MKKIMWIAIIFVVLLLCAEFMFKGNGMGALNKKYGQPVILRA